MPKPMLGQRRAHFVDALLLLRDAANDTAESATGSEAAKYFCASNIDLAKVAVEYEDISGVDGSNHWAIAVEVSDTENGTYTEIANSGPLPATGPVEVPISGLHAASLDFEPKWIRATATKTGTAGDVNYSAFVTPAY